MKPMTEKHFAVLRRHMVEAVGIHADLIEEELGKPALDARVLEAMLRVPRHLFVPASLAALAYQDTPLPIGFDKTISQPFMCALMTDLLAPGPDEAVLEVGTGLGYQTAVLAELAGRVWSVEIVEECGHLEGFRVRGLRHRRIRPPHRRLEGIEDGTCGLRPRRSGAGAARPPSAEGRPHPS